MPPYETDYPSAIVLSNDPNTYNLTLNDNQERVLITETKLNIIELRDIFRKEGFNDTIVEEKKPFQIGQGALKHISDDWDMHVRFLSLHDGLIAIDGEVETSRKWVEHNTANNWISVIYEITNILQKYNAQFIIWHKKLQNYVEKVVQKMGIKMEPLGKIEWKHVAIGVGIIGTLGLIAWALTRKTNSKDEDNDEEEDDDDDED